MSKHDQALSQPAVTEEELDHLEKQIMDQGNAVKEAKAACREAKTPQAKAQVSLLPKSAFKPTGHAPAHFPLVA